MVRVSNATNLTSLTPQEREKLRLSAADIKKISEDLVKAVKALDQLGFAAQERTFKILRQDLEILRKTITENSQRKVPMGNAQRQRSYDPTCPQLSLQEIADNEPRVKNEAVIPDFVIKVQEAQTETLNFRAHIGNPHWIQGEYVNADNLISARKFGGKARLHEEYNSEVNGMKNPGLYADLHSHQVSDTPKDGYRGFMPWGSWENAEQSEDYDPNFHQSWRAATSFALHFRSGKAVVDISGLTPQPEVRKHLAMGNKITLELDTPRIDIVHTDPLETIYDSDNSIRPERNFTKENPGRPGEKIDLLLTQKLRASVLPVTTGRLKLGECNIADFESSFDKVDPGTFVECEYKQVFTYSLDFKIIGRGSEVWVPSGQEVSFAGETRVSDKERIEPFTGRPILLVYTCLHAYPRPLNKLELVGSRTSRGAAVNYYSNGTKTEALDLSTFQSAQAQLIGIVGQVLEIAFKEKPAEWRDGVLRITACEQESSDFSASGIFKEGGVWKLRFHVEHAVDGKLTYVVALPADYIPTGLAPKVDIRFRGNFAELRTKEDSSSPRVSGAFAKIKQFEGEWISKEAVKKYENTIGQLEKKGTLLQQDKTEAQDSALLLRKLINSFGEEILYTDFELAMLENESISNSLGHRWQNPNDNLLNIAAALAVQKKLDPKSEPKSDISFKLVDAALSQLIILEARFQKARERGATYGDPSLNIMAEYFTRAYAENQANKK